MNSAVEELGISKREIITNQGLTPISTIIWTNGADLAPEYIYFQAFRNEPELQVKFKEWGYIA